MPCFPPALQEESRLAREVAEAEQKSAADEAARKQRIKDTLAAMHRSNQLQLKHKVRGGSIPGPQILLSTTTRPLDSSGNPGFYPTCNRRGRCSWMLS
jgi:hypothetical protein